MPAWVPSWLRDPLVHFLLIGGVLFAAYGLLGPDANDPKSITVSRDALVTFVQYRANAFQGDLFDKSLDELTAAELEALVDEYVREEALYREALAMGLDEGDYVIRQRVIQRLEFLLESGIDGGIDEDGGRAELEAFYAESSEDYREPPVYTFAHVFFNGELRGDEEAREGARQLLTELNDQGAPFSAAIGLGDRPLYFQNYIERTRDFLESHLGPDLTSALDRIEPSASTWHGPMRSPYGWHLVLLTERRPARLPRLEEIEDRVREDRDRIRVAQARRTSIDRIVEGYEVRLVGLDTETSAAKAPQ